MGERTHMRVIFLLDLGTPVSFRGVRGLNDMGQKACVGTSVLGMKGETGGVTLSEPIMCSTLPLLTRGDMDI